MVRERGESSSTWTMNHPQEVESFSSDGSDSFLIENRDSLGSQNAEKT